ncbi:MAG: hypothetical protein OXK74_13505 [Gemmatimonadota bacterium]|nr:hypothetical protein [Gemmatimonadota bacterium]
MDEVADGDGESIFVFVLPVESQWTGTLASITLAGPAGTATLDGESDNPMSILRDRTTGRVRAFLDRSPPTPPGSRSSSAAESLIPKRGADATRTAVSATRPGTSSRQPKRANRRDEGDGDREAGRRHAGVTLGRTAI